MPCHYPIPAYRNSHGDVSFTKLRRDGDIVKEFEVPCGQCMGCRIMRAEEWRFRSVCESRMHDENCFLTLTYGEGQMPPNASLCYEDFQKFIRRTRKYLGKPLRFHMCGEYGDLTGRPHYHASIFGHGFFADRRPAGKSGSGQVYYNTPQLDKLWPHGHATVQDFTPATAGYVAQYICKKILGKDAKSAYNVVLEDGTELEREPPFTRSSLKPGIGGTWFDEYGSTDIEAHDFAILDGGKVKMPRYFDKLRDRKDPLAFDQVKADREFNGVHGRRPEDETRRRLDDREQVLIARLSNRKRNFE